MSDLDSDVDAFLSRAHRGLSPEPNDGARVLAALGSKQALSSGEGRVAPRSDSRFVRGAKLGGGLVALGLALATGYGWGYRAGQNARSPAVVAAPILAAPILVPPAPPVVAAAPPRDVQEGASMAPLESPRSNKSTSVVRPSIVVPPEPAVSAGLDEEVRQLRRIERAIRDDNPRLALAIGDNLDHELPHGQLRQEREAARLMASCQLDAAANEEQAMRFLAKSPSSAYAARLRELCGIAENEQRNGAALGTSSAESGGAR